MIDAGAPLQTRLFDLREAYTELISLLPGRTRSWWTPFWTGPTQSVGPALTSSNFDPGSSGVRLLLASALPLTPLLLLACALLLTPSAGEPAHDALGLVGYASDGVLRPLNGLPGLVGHLACGFLLSSASLLAL